MNMVVFDIHSNEQIFEIILIIKHRKFAGLFVKTKWHQTILAVLRVVPVREMMELIVEDISETENINDSSGSMFCMNV